MNENKIILITHSPNLLNCNLQNPSSKENQIANQLTEVMEFSEFSGGYGINTGLFLKGGRALVSMTQRRKGELPYVDLESERGNKPTKM